MKFERPKTERSRKRLNRVFYFSFGLIIAAWVLRVLEDNINSDISFISSMFFWLSVLSAIVLLVLYVTHVFISHKEKPIFTPTETHNKFKNANASEAGSDGGKTRRPF